MWDKYNKVYPWYNFTIYTGLGRIPYGNLFFPKNSDDLIMSNSSILVGVSYDLTNIPIGFYAESSLFHYYVSFSWKPDDLHLNPDYNLHYLFNESHSTNIGVLLGKEVSKNWGIFGKLGVGLTQNKYSVNYITSNGHMIRGITEHQSNVVYNYQLGVNMRYFPTPFVGVTSGLSFSHNLPAFNISLAWKFGYKKIKQ